MRRSSVSLAFPPFTGAVRTLVIINGAIYFLLLLMQATGQGHLAGELKGWLALVPERVLFHWRFYELVTYGFAHETFSHIFFNMLSLWMFGSMLEQAFGSRKFLEFYFFGIIGAAIGTIIISYTFGSVLHAKPYIGTVGASGGIYAIFMAVAMLFGNQEVFLFPLPFRIKLKYMVAILALIALASALGDSGGTANAAHLSGLVFGWIYIKFVPRRGLGFAFSEGYYGIRNGYHRWKRRRAAKKFQVYMRKHQHDPKQYFDEYGNFKPPDDKDKDRGPGGWVN
jgi:membrane associated rhomboid family serine protease